MGCPFCCTWNVIAFVVALTLLFWIYGKSRSRAPQFTNIPVKTMVILGSGGHTKEILSITETLSPSLYSPIVYVYSKSDDLSRKKAIASEEERSSSSSAQFSIHSIFRSRNVGQSWITSCFTTVISTLHAISILVSTRPGLILCNGPGVCVPLCLVAFLSTKLGLMHCKMIYVESICRVKSLSLSGVILRHFVDKFFVQWESQAKMYPGSHFIGRLS